MAHVHQLPIENGQDALSDNSFYKKLVIAYGYLQSMNWSANCLVNMFEISGEMFCHRVMNVVKAMELMYVVKDIVLQMATLKNDLDNI